MFYLEIGSIDFKFIMRNNNTFLFSYTGNMMLHKAICELLQPLFTEICFLFSKKNGICSVAAQDKSYRCVHSVLLHTLHCRSRMDVKISTVIINFQLELQY